jgi:hypothetical protein
MGEKYNGSDLHASHNDARWDAQLQSWSENRDARSEAMQWIVPNEVVAFVFDMIKRDSRAGRGGQSQPSPVSTRKPPSQSFPPGHGNVGGQPFMRQSVSLVPEGDLDQLIEALSDDGHELQDETSIKDMTNYLSAMGNRISGNGQASSKGAGAQGRLLPPTNGKKGSPATPSKLA